jgi:hypothetical protein
MAKAPEQSGALCFLASQQRLAEHCSHCVPGKPFGSNPLLRTQLHQGR